MRHRDGKLGDAPQFDPYGTLAALEDEGVAYIVIGAFARVIHGTDETTRGIDLTPSTRERNLRRLDTAVDSIGARRSDGGEASVGAADLAHQRVIELWTDCGEVKIVPIPEGTRGYDDLRREVRREPIGRGLRPAFASPDDLARMLGALGRDQDVPNLMMLRRLIELDRVASRGRSIER
jgi:hypothetical protein